MEDEMVPQEVPEQAGEEMMDPMAAFEDLLSQLQEKYQIDQADIDMLVDAVYSLSDAENSESETWTCPECGMEVPMDQTVCPECGFSMEAPAEEQTEEA